MALWHVFCKYFFAPRCGIMKRSVFLGILFLFCALLSCQAKGNGSDNQPEKSTIQLGNGCEVNETDSFWVVKVQDGDTYDILLPCRQTARIRMLGIDAPEKGQDFSKKSAQYLRSMVIQRYVTLKNIELDQYGRILAYTYLPDGSEASREMLKAGLAWHFKRYNSSRELEDLEREAKERRLGLWADKYPVEPWFERPLRKKGYKSVEIKQMKVQGRINSLQSVKNIPKKSTK